MRDRQIGMGGRVTIALLGMTIGLATANAQDAGPALASAKSGEYSLRNRVLSANWKLSAGHIAEFNVSDKLTVGNQRLQWLKCLHFSQTICFFLVISVKISIRRTRRFGSGT